MNQHCIYFHENNAPLHGYTIFSIVAVTLLLTITNRITFYESIHHFHISWLAVELVSHEMTHVLSLKVLLVIFQSIVTIQNV